MTRRRKLAFAVGAGGLALVVGGFGAAGAIAASRMPSLSEESKAVIAHAENRSPSPGPPGRAGLTPMTRHRDRR